MNRVPINEITIDNYEEVYKDYRDYRAHTLAPKIGHYAVGQLFSPNVFFDEGAKEHIESKFANRNPIILAANHVRYIDHFIIGAAWQREKALHGFINNTMVYAKAPYFNEPKSKWMTELMGGVPVWRDRDFPPEKLDEMALVLGNAGLALIKMSLEQMQSGRNVFMFPEGTRNLGDWAKVSPLQSGLGHLAAKAWKQKELMDTSVVPVGIAYDTSSHFDWRKPVVYIGAPIVACDGFMYPKPIINEVEKRLQETVDAAQLELKNAA